MFRVEGLDEAQRAFDRLARKNFMKRPLRVFGAELQRKMQTYPPLRNPGDRRTGDLARSWYNVPQTRRVEVGARASYAGWVEDERKQVWYHQDTGWPTVQDEADKLIPELEQKIIDAVYRELGL